MGGPARPYSARYVTCPCTTLVQRDKSAAGSEKEAHLAKDFCTDGPFLLSDALVGSFAIGGGACRAKVYCLANSRANSRALLLTEPVVSGPYYTWAPKQAEARVAAPIAKPQ